MRDGDDPKLGSRALINYKLVGAHSRSVGQSVFRIFFAVFICGFVENDRKSEISSQSAGSGCIDAKFCEQRFSFRDDHEIACA